MCGVWTTLDGMNTEDFLFNYNVFSISTSFILDFPDKSIVSHLIIMEFLNYLYQNNSTYKVSLQLSHAFLKNKNKQLDYQKMRT